MYLKDIAGAEEISEKYLSLLVIPLRHAGLIHSIRGAYGGYTLAKAPSQINLGEIVAVLEGDCIVDCLKNPSALTRKYPWLCARSHWSNGCPNWKENEGPTRNRQTGAAKKTKAPANRMIEENRGRSSHLQIRVCKRINNGFRLKNLLF
jgi:hypothetical protein